MQLAVVFNHGFYLPHIERVTGLLEMRGFLSVGSGNLASHHIHERAVAQIKHGAGAVKFRWLVGCDSFYFRAYKAVRLIALSLCQRYCA